MVWKEEKKKEKGRKGRQVNSISRNIDGIMEVERVDGKWKLVVVAVVVVVVVVVVAVVVVVVVIQVKSAPHLMK